jgi:hypothetical protein
LKKKNLTLTELEWNDFENKLKVLTTNPVEARQLLTPDLMLDLFNWWQAKQQDIRVSFYKNKMHILVEDNRVRTEPDLTHFTPQDPQVHLYSVTLPLLHILHLAEDIRE